MAAGWYHEVSPGWLEARKQFFTATDAVKLRPAYKRAIKAGWKPGDDVPEFVALAMEKQSDQVGETKVYGSAARGHIMEPYAVEELGKILNCNVRHVDDILIYRDDYGFSPDCMEDVVLPYEWRMDCKGDATKIFRQPKFVVEIKSYEPWKFGKTVSAGKYEDEKLQLAMAFKVFDKMDHAYLFLYCPAANSYKLTRFHRTDLEDEIKLIDGMLYMWRNIYPLHLPGGNDSLLYTEESIYRSWQESQATMFNLK